MSYSCAAPGCAEEAIIHISEARDRRLVAEHHCCRGHADQYMTARRREDTPAAATVAAWSALRRCDVDCVVIDQSSDYQFLYLYEPGGAKMVSLAVGIFEATAIVWLLRGFKPPRPLTHAALVSTIKALGGSIHSAVIDDIIDGVYIANLRIHQALKLVNVDLRVSDAVAIAMQAGAPIEITDDVLRRAPPNGWERHYQQGGGKGS
jgi:bifunctional DNase/RNase